MAKRALPDGEIALARGIFGDSIDYETVRVYDTGYAFFHKSGGMSYRGNIYLPGCHHHDFSKAPLLAQRLFIHEMTHVWQHQNKVLHLAGAAVWLGLKHKFNYAKAYLFHLEAGKDLTDYGMEQQAAIIEEYFLRQHGSSFGRCLNTGDDIPELLEGVLEAFLKNPAYPRRKRFPYPLPRQAAMLGPENWIKDNEKIPIIQIGRKNTQIVAEGMGFEPTIGG